MNGEGALKGMIHTGNITRAKARKTKKILA